MQASVCRRIHSAPTKLLDHVSIMTDSILCMHPLHLRPCSRATLQDVHLPVLLRNCLGTAYIYGSVSRAATLSLHFMICHSKRCHRPCTSSCHKEQPRWNRTAKSQPCSVPNAAHSSHPSYSTSLISQSQPMSPNMQSCSRARGEKLPHIPLSQAKNNPFPFVVKVQHFRHSKRSTMTCQPGPGATISPSPLESL